MGGVATENDGRHNAGMVKLPETAGVSGSSSDVGSSVRSGCSWRACHDCMQPPNTVKGMKRFSMCGMLMLVFGLGFLIVAILIPTVLEQAVYDSLRQATVLSSASAPGFDNWSNNQNNPLIVYAYFYDIVNAHDWLAGVDEQPHFVEVGPFAYYDLRQNDDATWNSDATVINYAQYIQFQFIPELSAQLNDSQQITTFNMYIQGIIATLGPGVALQFANLFKLNEYGALFTTASVHELLFGFKNPQVNYANVPGFFNATMTAAPIQYSMYTGVNNLALIRQYITVAGSPVVGAWNTSVLASADSVSGHDGAQFGPVPIALEPEAVAQNMRIYFANYKRVVSMVYGGGSQYKGVDLFRFVFPSSLFENSSEYPLNAAYYMNGPSGFVNLTKVAQKTPLFGSEPHFAGVDPALLSGMWLEYLDSAPPGTFFDVEPYSGASFHFITSSQVNLWVGPTNTSTSTVPGPLWFSNITWSYYPVFWAYEEGGVDDASAETFRSGVYGAFQMADIFMYVGYVVGSLLVAAGILGLFGVYRHYRRFTRLLVHERSKLLPADAQRRDSLGGDQHDTAHAAYQHANSATSPAAASSSYVRVDEDNKAAHADADTPHHTQEPIALADDGI